MKEPNKYSGVYQFFLLARPNFSVGPVSHHYEIIGSFFAVLRKLRVKR
jgi:hypothetical protein